MLAEDVRKLEQENVELKAQVKELESICGNKAELPRNCEYCKNFIQHYIRTGNSYYPTYDGHCMAGNKIKGREVKDTCKAFAKRIYGKNRI